MKNEQLQQEVKQLIENYLEAKKVSAKKLAEHIGVSNGTISNIINEVWERVNDSMLLKIKSFFKVKNWVLVNTQNFLIIQEACDRARQTRVMSGIVGFAGAGKTTALKHYYENHPETFMITCSRTMRTKQLLAEILRALGVNYIASDYEMMRLIIETMNKRQNPLLIIDEASKLSPNALMYLQDIWDGIEHNAGLILAGMEYLYTNMKKASERNRTGMPEFFGRIASWHYLNEITKSEIKAICEHNGVKDTDKVLKISNIHSFRDIRNIIYNLSMDLSNE